MVQEEANDQRHGNRRWYLEQLKDVAIVLRLGGTQYGARGMER